MFFLPLTPRMQDRRSDVAEGLQVSSPGGMVGHGKLVKDFGENWSPVKLGFHPKTVYGCLHSN